MWILGLFLVSFYAVIAACQEGKLGWPNQHWTNISPMLISNSILSGCSTTLYWSNVEPILKRCLGCIWSSSYTNLEQKDQISVIKSNFLETYSIESLQVRVDYVTHSRLLPTGIQLRFRDERRIFPALSRIYLQRRNDIIWCYRRLWPGGKTRPVFLNLKLLILDRKFIPTFIKVQCE